MTKEARKSEPSSLSTPPLWPSHLPLQPYHIVSTGSEHYISTALKMRASISLSLSIIYKCRWQSHVSDKNQHCTRRGPGSYFGKNTGVIHCRSHYEKTVYLPHSRITVHTHGKGILLNITG